MTRITTLVAAIALTLPMACGGGAGNDIGTSLSGRETTDDYIYGVPGTAALSPSERRILNGEIDEPSAQRTERAASTAPVTFTELTPLRIAATVPRLEHGGHIYENVQVEKMVSRWSLSQEGTTFEGTLTYHGWAVVQMDGSEVEGTSKAVADFGANSLQIRVHSDPLPFGDGRYLILRTPKFQMGVATDQATSVKSFHREGFRSTELQIYAFKDFDNNVDNGGEWRNITGIHEVDVGGGRSTTHGATTMQYEFSEDGDDLTTTTRSNCSLGRCDGEIVIRTGTGPRINGSTSLGE